MVVFLAIAGLSQLLAYQRYVIVRDSQNQRILNEANLFKERFLAVLENSRSATKTLAFIVTKYGGAGNFDSVAAGILEANKYIDVLQITNKGVITHVYPLAGNEQVVGFDLFTDPARRIEAMKAMEKRSLFFAGPFELKQGGLGVIGRLPMYDGNQFKGFSAALIRFPTMLRALGVNQNETEFVYQLSKRNPLTGKNEFFLPVPDNTENAELLSVDVPEGDWKLYVGMRNPRWFPGVIFFSLLGLILAVTGGFFAWNLAWQPEKLNRLVRLKTSEIVKQKQNMVTTLERVSDAFVALDTNWCYTYMNKKAGEIFGRDPEQMIGKNIWTEFPEGIDQPFYRAYHKAMAEQKYISIEEYYPPYDLWFENHIYPSPNGLSVYFRDISDRIKSARQVEREKLLSDSIINSLPGVFYLFDKQGKYLRWNRNFEIVSGYTGEEISRADPLVFITRDERDLVRKSIQQAFEQGNAEVTAHVATRDGKIIPYYFSGRKVTFDNQDFLIGMGIDISERVEIEMALLERNEEIQKLTTYLQDIREEERTHMAREIHDVLGQQLTAMKMDTSWLRKNVSDEKAVERLAAMVGLIDETIRTVRKLSSQLRPGVLDDLGLVAALEWQTAEFEKNTGIPAAFDCNVHEVDLEQTMATHVFRIYQETLTNIARHAMATLVTIRLNVTGELLKLEVTDNGRGFDLSEVKAKKRLGLVGMRERARLYGGAISIGKNEPSGTVIVLTVPLQKPVTVSL